MSISIVPASAALLSVRTTSLVRRSVQSGFSLVSAIFLLVILAMLGVAILNISTVQHTTSAQDILGARAYQAARAGIEWGLYRHRQMAGAYCSNAAVPDTQTFALPAGSSLSNFTVTVTCTFVPFAGAAALDRRQILAVACNYPGAGACPNPSARSDYVARELQVEF